MFSPTYRYLDRRVRLAGLSLIQWLQLVIAAILAYGVAQLLELAGVTTTYALSVSITLAGSPLVVVFVAMDADFDVFVYARAAARWTRSRKLLLAGTNPHVDYAGYLIVPSVDSGESDHLARRDRTLVPEQMQALWDRN